MRVCLTCAQNRQHSSSVETRLQLPSSQDYYMHLTWNLITDQSLITSVLSIILERIVVKYFLYPAPITPPAPLSFSDQYAFRPTGSTTAALIGILHSNTYLLSSNPFVIVFALDLSKAFDTVRHAVTQGRYPEHSWCRDRVHLDSGVLLRT